MVCSKGSTEMGGGPSSSQTSAPYSAKTVKKMLMPVTHCEQVGALMQAYTVSMSAGPQSQGSTVVLGRESFTRMRQVLVRGWVWADLDLYDVEVKLPSSRLFLLHLILVIAVVLRFLLRCAPAAPAETRT